MPGTASSSESLDDGRVGHPAALAHHLESEPATTAFELVHGLGGQDGTGTTQGMAQSDGATDYRTRPSEDFARALVEYRDADGNEARITVIAFGKLGGSELNYSSDIDMFHRVRVGVAVGSSDVGVGVNESSVATTMRRQDA